MTYPPLTGGSRLGRRTWPRKSVGRGKARPHPAASAGRSGRREPPERRTRYCGKAWRRRRCLFSRGGAADAPPAPPRCRCAPRRVGDPTSPAAPTAPAWAPAERHATLAELASRRGQLTHLQPQRYAWGRQRGGRPDSSRNPPPRKKTVPRSGPLPTRGRSPTPACRGRTPCCARGRWVQQHAAAQHVHGAMITQQTHSRRNASPGRWSKRT
jgi:hypothetical protein